MMAAVSRTPFAIDRVIKAPVAIGEFQMMLLNIEQQAAVPKRSFADLGSARQTYLERWINLDSMLLSRLDRTDRLVAFGGGQAASLLRAYAPRIWEQLEMIVLDDVTEGWNLGKPLRSYAAAMPYLSATAVLTAIAPRAQKVIAERLQKDGLRPICYDDLVPR